MPYASIHYPFKNKDKFQQDSFPADFIAEGLDQTRGWFYTLTVLGNKLFGVSPFKNCIVNGIVLAEDGKKMSKRLKNYPDPSLIMDQYGSDALRLYLINSPVVRAESIRFKETGVKEIVARVLLPLWNSYRFFSEQALLFKKNTGEDFVAAKALANEELSNVMDKWILANCQSLLLYIEQEMAAYRLYTVVPRLLRVIDDLTNWYIRFNRKRLKGGAGLGIEDTKAALNTLIQVLFTIVRALAPFTPFLTEHIYGLLRPYLGPVLEDYKDSRSVHFLPFPTVQQALFDEVVERKVAAMQKVIQLARTARERQNIPLKTPLLSIVVIADAEILADVESLSSYVKEELNIRNVVLTSDEARYNVQLEAKVDWPTLGKKLKKDVQVVKKGLPKLTQDELRAYVRDKTISVDGIKLDDNDLNIIRVLGQETLNNSSSEDGGAKWEPAFAEDVIVLLDCAPHPELAEEGIARDIITRIQKMRKKAGLVPTDDVRMEYSVVAEAEDVDVGAVVKNREDLFRAALRGPLEAAREGAEVLLEEEQVVGELTLLLRLAKL